MSGAGNDFIIIDARKIGNANRGADDAVGSNYEFSAEQISKISNRKNIGCDQFILLKNSLSADILMEIYNSDGSKSGACGNATRCVAAILIKEKTADKISIETATGILSAWIENDLISVDMGKPKFDWNEIPLREQKNTEYFMVDGVTKYHFSALNIGNPHIVTFLNSDLSDQQFLDLGSKLEINSLFPQKTNVEFAQIITPTHIKVRVWERGAGETLACGSGACAVAVTAIRKNLTPREKLKISFKGGDLFINWLENGSVIMYGGYQKIADGVFDDSFL